MSAKFDWRQIVPGQNFNGLVCPTFRDERNNIRDLKREDFGPVSGDNSDVARAFYQLYLLDKAKYEYEDYVAEKHEVLDEISGVVTPESTERKLRRKLSRFSTDELARLRAMLAAAENEAA